MTGLLFKDESYQIIGACMEVHRELGCGFLEAVYQEALELEFIQMHIPYIREKELPIYYKGTQLQKTYRADFVCFGGIIVELKAQNALTGIDTAQVINYLKATGFELGILVNFGESSLKYERVINGRK
jgi:GxxExxY protein